MAFQPGFKSWASLNGTVLASYADGIDNPQSIESLEVSNFGTTAKAYLAGIAGGDTVNIKGPFDQTIQAMVGTLKAQLAAGSASHTFIFAPGGSVSGQAKISQETIIKSYKPSSTAAGRVEWALDLQVTGAVTNGVW